jgi:CubicO group peptidase (beta-lactamase class C family)
MIVLFFVKSNSAKIFSNNFIHKSQIIVQIKLQEIMSFKINAFCLKFTSMLGCMLLCLTAFAQYNFSTVDGLLQANQKALGNDIATIIYKDDKIVYQKMLGEEFNLKTRALIGNASQWLTAALVMTFVDEGKISLDEKVSNYLPIFETYGKTYITIRQCLTHTIGIADNSKSLGKILDRKKFESLEEEVNSFVKKEIAAAPGTSFFYGTMGPNIAGRVLEVITKKSFDALMKQRIFTPLEMKNSSFVPEDGSVDPSSGAESSAADLANFLSMILNKGMYKGKRILSEKAIAEMETTQTAKATKKYVPNVMETAGYGLGVWMENGNNGNVTTISAPSFSGTWPYIDRCRNYACIFFIKKQLGDAKKDLYLELKSRIDAQITASCK